MTDTDEQKFDIDENELKKFNEDVINSSLITPDKIYLDLALLKDLNIGVILSILYDRKPSMQPGEYASLYKQLIAALPTYNKRSYDDVEHLFPFLKISNAEFRARFTDEAYASFILHNAPMTKFRHTLTGQLMINVNHSAVSGKRAAIELTLNTYPLKLSKSDEYLVGFFLAKTYNVNTCTQYINLKNLDASHVVKYDEIYTYYLPELLASDSVRQAYSSMKCVMKRLFVPRIFGPTYRANWDVVKEELATKTRMDIMTRLDYFDTERCSPDIPETEKEV